MSTTSLAGCTSIVTGASRGFGRAVAVALVANGANVVGVARDRPALEGLRSQLGTSFTPVVADVADDTIASRLIAEHQPRILVLNAGATPYLATIQDQTWETFSGNWNVDVRHVFEFARAARNGSPMSGGYAGAKATIGFISSYAGSESERRSLGIRFVALLPKLTPATGLGSTFVDADAGYAGIGTDAYLEQHGSMLTAEQVADAVIHLVAHGSRPAPAPAYLLTADGLTSQ